MTSHEWGKDQIVITTNGTYSWIFVAQIFCSGSPSQGGDRKTFEMMTLLQWALSWHSRYEIFTIANSNNGCIKQRNSTRYIVIYYFSIKHAQLRGSKPCSCIRVVHRVCLDFCFNILVEIRHIVWNSNDSRFDIYVFILSFQETHNGKDRNLSVYDLIFIRFSILETVWPRMYTHISSVCRVLIYTVCTTLHSSEIFKWICK